jgi:hypothetical protein
VFEGAVLEQAPRVIERDAAKQALQLGEHGGQDFE